MRIPGIIILALGTAGYFFKLKGALIIAAIGIILILAPKKHSKEMLELCKKSIKQWKTIITTAFYDAVFWLITAGLLIIFTKWESAKAIQAQIAMKLTSETIIQPELLQQNINSLQNFLIHAAILGAILTALSLAVYTISRGLIWTKIAKIKRTKKFFLKFLGLNTIWWLIWLPIYILFLAAAAKAGTKIGIIAIIAISAYFTPILHTLFTKKQQIRHSLGHGISYGITKIHKLIIPYTYALIAYIIIYQPLRLVPEKALTTASLILVVIWLAWLRTYLYEVIKKF